MHPIENHLQQRLPQYLELLRRMVDINSFTANPQGVNRLCKLTADVFASLGFQPEFVQSTNPDYGTHLFLTRSPANRPLHPEADREAVIALVSHLDTVFPPEEELNNDFAWRVIGERIYGPGTVDIKGGTVMIYMVLEALQTCLPQIYNAITWQIGLDASEEALSDDFGTLLLQRLPQNTKACLVFEGGTPSNNGFPVVVARKGRATFQVTAQGRSAHAGNNHHLGANAILALARAVQEIESFTNYAQKITFNVGTISGGSVINRVPHQAEAGVEMRAFSPGVFEEGFQRITALNGISVISSTDGFNCQISVRPVYQTSPWPRNEQTDRLLSLWKDTGFELGMHVSEEERGGLSDGNFIWKHFPTLDGVGPTGNNAHCSERSPNGNKDQEYVLATSFVPKALMNILAIQRLVESAEYG